MTFVIVVNAVAVAVCVGLLFAVVRTGYVVAGRTPRVERGAIPLPVEQRDTLERAA
jgi:hypothetical protein